MRFRRLDLLRYGKFTDHRTEFPSEGLDLHLVIGSNEAGKSTTRAALTELLFGVDNRTPYAFLHDYGNLRIGAELEQGDETLIIRRKKGNKNTLLDEVERPLPEQALTSFLGKVNRDVFLRTFSLDHESLVEGAQALLDAKDDVGRMLFQASGGLHRLGDLRRELETEADRLWAPRRSKDRAYFTALDQYQTANQDLENHIVRVKDFRSAEALVETTHGQVQACAVEQENVLRRCSRLERVRRTLPGLVRRRNLKSELLSLDDVPLLPENAAAVLQEAQTQIARSHEEHKRLTELLESTRKKLQVNQPNTTLLRFATDIQLLGERRHELRRFPDDLAKRRAEVQLLVSQVEEHVAELGWSNRPASELKQRLPSALELEGVEQLLAQHERYDLAVSNAQQALMKRQEELAELMSARDASCDRGAPERLRQAVEAAQRLGDVEARRRELSVPAELSKRRLLAAFAQLAPWQGDLSALRAVAPPSDEELEPLAQRFERHQKDKEQINSERTRESAKLESLKLKELQVRRDASPVTRQELETARTARDQQWQSLRTQLEQGREATVSDPNLVSLYEATCLRADELADQRFDAATASITLQRTRAELEQLELLLSQLDQRLIELDANQRLLDEALAKLTPEATLHFDHPTQLRRWLGLRRDALTLGETAERERLSLQQLDRDIALCEASLRSELTECGLFGRVEEPIGFTATLRLAVNHVSNLDEHRARQLALLEQARKLERSLPEQQAALVRSETTQRSWQQSYTEALNRLGLPSETSPAVAKAALNLLREVSVKLSKIASIERDRIDTMTRDLEQFATAVQEVLRATAIELAELSPFEQAQGLLLRLQEQQQVAHDQAQAEATLTDLQRRDDETEERRSRAEATLRPLYELARVTDLVSLSATIDRSNRKRQLQRSREHEERALLEAGDGFSLEELETEATAIDGSLLESQLKEQKEQATALGLRRKALDIAHADAERALAAIAGQSNAAAAATRRNEALASMTDTMERYLQVRTMSMLLKWSMERFRREKQGPLLARSSELFCTLTLGQFQGLTVMTDDNDQPQLLGVRPSGTTLALGAMSTGTTDQLYLALRIAALELHLDSAPALPFVADDLFVQFDDERSAAAFTVLAGLARRTQVLFFTHHEHLIQVAQNALGNAVHVARL
jgi:uncharacterized protein YhaN